MAEVSLQHQPWYVRRPLVALAPMEDITDNVYRRLVRSIDREVVLYTEFTNASGLLAGAERVWQMLEFTEEQRPLVMQLYDYDAEKLGTATGDVVRRCRPDGIDLNMGCPVRKVANRGAGCGMMADPVYAAEAVKRMVDASGGVPVSVKTRLGIRRKDEILEVAERCLEAGAAQITIHGRLKADRPRTPADWDAVSRAAVAIPVPVMGNGDIWNEHDALRMIELPGIDGVMLARAAIGNPWVLRRCRQALAGEPIDPLPDAEERARIALKHLRLNVEEKGDRRGVVELRKVVRNYIKGFSNTRRTWMRIIETEDLLETARILETFAREAHAIDPIHYRTEPV
ncbi:hypothetical protein GF324_00330 [bacterium]|nr:hypothetical protein [bacterium]